MKSLLFLLYCVPILTFSQSFQYPVLQSQAKEIESFIPEGWTILDSAIGDLNKDNLSDLVLVIQKGDSISKLIWDVNEIDTIFYKPRVLIFATRDSINQNYLLKLQHNTFIPKYTNRGEFDPYGSIEIRKGVLMLQLSYGCTMGCWEMTGVTYKFRFKSSKLQLIGADESTIHRSSGESSKYSINFLSGKWSKQIGNEFEGKWGKIEWYKLESIELKTLDMLHEAGEWEVIKGELSL